MTAARAAADELHTGSGEPPAVSVVIPTHQRRERVERAIASVLAQSYTDFELIVIDDGSTDATDVALAPFADRLLYRWQENAGVSAARNHGIRLGRGSIIAFLDSDDQWLPDHLAVVVEMLDRDREAVVASTTPLLVIGGRQRPSRAKRVEILPRHFLGNMLGYPSSMAARTEALRSVGGFDERLQTGEDRELWVRLARLGSFTTLRRRTILRSYSGDDSLQRWGLARGCSLEANAAIVEGTVAVAAPGTARERREANGGLMLVRALRAIDRADDRAAEVALAEACRDFTAPAREAELFEDRLSYLTGSLEPDERLRHLVTTAELWPDPAADTAMYLRLLGIVAALSRWRVGAAARLLRNWPLLATPGFALRAVPPLARRIRRTLAARRSREDAAVELEGTGLARPHEAAPTPR